MDELANRRLRDLRARALARHRPVAAERVERVAEADGRGHHLRGADRVGRRLERVLDPELRGGVVGDLEPRHLLRREAQGLHRLLDLRDLRVGEVLGLPLERLLDVLEVAVDLLRVLAGLLAGEPALAPVVLELVELALRHLDADGRRVDRLALRGRRDERLERAVRGVEVADRLLVHLDDLRAPAVAAVVPRVRAVVAEHENGADGLGQDKVSCALRIEILWALS